MLARNSSFLAFIFILIAVRWSLADQYMVPTGSMEPTIQVGDRIFVSKAHYDLKLPFTNVTLVRRGEPQKGDIVVFKHPKNSLTLVKRLVGLPGERVVIHDGFSDLDITVPPDHYFMMGDNRGNSSDSREWGFVPRGDLKGRALRVLYNFNHQNLSVDWTRTGQALN